MAKAVSCTEPQQPMVCCQRKEGRGSQCSSLSLSFPPFCPTKRKSQAKKKQKEGAVLYNTLLLWYSSHKKIPPIPFPLLPSFLSQKRTHAPKRLKILERSSEKCDKDGQERGGARAGGPPALRAGVPPAEHQQQDGRVPRVHQEDEADVRGGKGLWHQNSGTVKINCTNISH